MGDGLARKGFRKIRKHASHTTDFQESTVLQVVRQERD